MDIQEIRAKFPQYNDLPDEQLVQGLHAKYYSDIPYQEFTSKIGGLSQSQEVAPQPAQSQPQQGGKSFFEHLLENMGKAGHGTPEEGQQNLNYRLKSRQN